MVEVSKFMEIDIADISKVYEIDKCDFVNKIYDLDVPSCGGQDGLFGGGYGYAQSNAIDSITISSLGNSGDFGDLTNQRYLIAATSNGSNGGRAIFGGGRTTQYVNTIDYVTIVSAGNASDFGDFSDTFAASSGTSNNTNDRGIFGGAVLGGGGNSNVIEYVTISSTGNTSDFGDLTQGRQETSATSNGTGNIGVFGGGQGPGGVDKVNIMDYVTITSLGNASDFGDLNADICRIAATSNLNNNMGVFGGGVDDSVVKYNVLQYIQINSTSNSSDFGDLTEAKCESSATSNGTEDRGVWGGGYAAARVNTMEYITISSLGNASDFGDFSSEAKNSLAATSNGS